MKSYSKLLRQSSIDAKDDWAESYLTALRRCRAKLATADEELLELHYGEGFGTRQIADRLQRLQSNVCHSLGSHSPLAVRVHSNGDRSPGAFRDGTDMSDVAINADHLLDLAEAVCDKTASKNDLVELKSLLLVDQTSCRRYLLYCEMHAALRFEVRADRAAQKVCQQVDIKSITQASPEVDLPDVDTPFPVPNFLSSTLHNTLGCFPEGMPLAYLIASVVTGLGILVASRVYVSRVTVAIIIRYRLRSVASSLHRSVGSLARSAASGRRRD